MLNGVKLNIKPEVLDHVRLSNLLSHLDLRMLIQRYEVNIV